MAHAKPHLEVDAKSNRLKGETSKVAVYKISETLTAVCSKVCKQPITQPLNKSVKRAVISRLHLQPRTFTSLKPNARIEPEPVAAKAAILVTPQVVGKGVATDTSGPGGINQDVVGASP